MSSPSSRPIAWPAAEMAPEAPKVQNKYMAERAGIARPEVIAAGCLWGKYGDVRVKDVGSMDISRDI